jgi:hypothetical protein
MADLYFTCPLQEGRRDCDLGFVEMGDLADACRKGRRNQADTEAKLSRFMGCLSRFFQMEEAAGSSILPGENESHSHE